MSLFDKAAALVRGKFENPEEVASEALSDLSDFGVEISLSDFELEHSIFLKGDHTALNLGAAFENVSSDLLDYISSDEFDDSGLLVSGDAINIDTFFRTDSKIRVFGSYEVTDHSLVELLSESLQQVDPTSLSYASRVLFLVTAGDLSTDVITSMCDLVTKSIGKNTEYCIGAFEEENEEEHPSGHFTCLYY